MKHLINLMVLTLGITHLAVASFPLEDHSFGSGSISTSMVGGATHITTTQASESFKSMGLNISARAFPIAYRVPILTVGTTAGRTVVHTHKTSHGIFEVYDTGGYKVTNYISPYKEPFGETPDDNPDFVDLKKFQAHLNDCLVTINESRLAPHLRLHPEGTKVASLTIGTPDASEPWILITSHGKFTRYKNGAIIVANYISPGFEPFTSLTDTTTLPPRNGLFRALLVKCGIEIEYEGDMEDVARYEERKVRHPNDSDSE